MKAYNFEKDKTVLILDDYEEISNLKSAIYSSKLVQLSYMDKTNDEKFKEIVARDINNLIDIENCIENGKICNKEISEYIQQQCEKYNIDTMQFIHICIKSYMMQCRLASTPRKRRR